MFLLQLLLYHAGYIPEIPKEPLPKTAHWPTLPPVMATTMERYLDARRLLDRPATMSNTEEGLRKFCTWLLTTRPEITSFAEVTRDDCLEFGAWMTTLTHRRTGRPLAPATRRARSQSVLGFFRDGYLWEWPEMPGRPLLINGDLLDFHTLSRFVKDPAARKFPEERAIAKQFLARLRELFPKARIVFKEGNHDERLQHFVMERAPELYDETIFGLDSLLGLEALGIEHVKEKREILLGKLYVLHGHELPRGIKREQPIGTRLHRIALAAQHVAEQLAVKVVVLDNKDTLCHERSPSPCRSI